MKKVKLGEVCEIKIGKTPNRSQTLYWGGDYSWLSISDMKEKILCTTKEKITQEAVQKEKMQIVPKGTVVMSFKLSIGKVGILAENMYTNEAIANFVVKNNKMLFNEYLYYALQGINFDSLTDRAVMGKTLNKAKLNNLSIVFNEPFMQQQIVLRLDGVNKLIESRKLQLSELLKLVKSRFNEMFGDPISNSLKLPIKKFEKVVTLQRGFDLPIQNRQVGEINVWGSNGIVATHTESKVTEQGIVTGRSGSIGKVYVTEKEYWPLNTTLFSKELHGNNPIFLKYLLEAFKLERFNNGTGVPTLNRNIVHKEDIIYVPLSLQNEFADFVAQVDKSQFACGIVIKLWRNSLKSSII